MPELVACPSCGCQVQVGEVQLGRQTRCIACGCLFVASAMVPDSPPSRSPGDFDPYPLRPDDQPEAPRRRDEGGRGPSRLRLPLCPRCHRPVEWDAPACVHCNHLFEVEDRNDPLTWCRRRDGEEHRAPLIDMLGSISLLCGILALCTAGIGVVVALITGLVAVILASNDLERMRRGELDPDGEGATRTGRNKALAGIALAVVFGGLIVLYFMNSIFALFP